MKSRRPTTLIPLLAALPACGFDAPEEVPTLLVPEDVELHWDDSFNAVDDGLVALVPIDVMIYDRVSGEPLAYTPILLQSLHADAGLLSPDAVLRVEPDDCLECGPIVWDAWRDRYVELLDEGPDTVARVRTDAWGLARVYVLADTFPVEGGLGEGRFAPIPIVVSMGITDDTFLLVPR